MLLGFSRRLPPALFALLCACSAVDAVPQAPPSGTPTTAIGAATLRFEKQGTIRADPSADVRVGLVVGEPIRLVTIALEGEYEDASLSASEIAVSGGRAEVTLRTPSVPSTFTLRARAEGAADARILVSVSAHGFSTVRVTPLYRGKRPAETFFASAVVKSTCAELAKGPLKDGAPVDVGTSSGPIVLTDVPAEGHVAILARVARYAGGCTDVDGLLNAATLDVTVDVQDLPLELRATYASSFTFDPDPTDAAAWQRMLDAAANRAADAFVPLARSESALLLDTIRDRVVAASRRDELEATRAQAQWDVKVQTWLGGRPPSLRERALGWMLAARGDVMGPLLAGIGAGSSKERALVFPRSFAALPAASVGLVAKGEFDWTADSEDTLHLWGQFVLAPTELVVSAADARAQLATPGATTVAEALAVQINCSGLASSLVGGGYAYGQCGVPCLALHCAEAFDLLWDDARGASRAASDELHLKMTASARARVADTPEPSTFEGAWVGDVLSSSGNFGMKGRADGKKE